MERMVTHCKIVPYNSDEPNICKYRYTPNELPPFEAVRIILEQSLYWSYLDTMCQGNSINDLYENINLNYLSLPGDISSANQGLRELYHLGKAAIEDILKKNYDAVRYEDCFAVFSTECPKDQDYHEYKCTLTQSFLNFWFLNVGKGVLPAFAFPKMQIDDPDLPKDLPSLPGTENFFVDILRLPFKALRAYSRFFERMGVEYGVEQRKEWYKDKKNEDKIHLWKFVIFAKPDWSLAGASGNAKEFKILRMNVVLTLGAKKTKVTEHIGLRGRMIERDKGICTGYTAQIIAKIFRQPEQAAAFAEFHEVESEDDIPAKYRNCEKITEQEIEMASRQESLYQAGMKKLAKKNKLKGMESFGDQSPMSVITDVALYLPSAKVIKNYDANIPDSENHNYQLCFNLEARPIQAFHIEENQFGHRSLWAMLSRVDFNRCSVDDLIGIIASFSVNHDNYVMNLNDPDTPICIVDLCYDLVTGSSPMYSSAGAVRQRPVLGHEEFIQLVKYLLDTHRLQPLQEYGLFGALLESLGTDPNIVNYFVRPDEAITGEEAYAFRTSRYASIIKDRLAVVGMEAADDDAPDDETEDTPDEGAEEGEADTPAMDPTEDPGAALGEDTLTDEPEEEADNRPEIDPDKMLLELAAPNETMADYIYREMVNRRITAILQNPPESARPNDLLMLKRWKSRWLYLTSIACLRDFLSRVNIRLSETIS